MKLDMKGIGVAKVWNEDKSYSACGITRALSELG